MFLPHMGLKLKLYICPLSGFFLGYDISEKACKILTEIMEDIVIVGAGIAGLATSLGLHRYLLSLYF